MFGCPKHNLARKNKSVYYAQALKFKQSNIAKKAVDNINKRFGFLDKEVQVTMKDTRTLYDLCRYPVAWYPKGPSAWCSVFNVEELKIQEDFLQISDLVHTENVFINRSTQSHPTNQSSPEEFLTEYHGSPALLSEKISASGQSVYRIYYWLKYDRKVRNFWILGANYNETSRINVRDDVNCGTISCYEKSVKNGQICKSGRFCLLQIKRCMYIMIWGPKRFA